MPLRVEMKRSASDILESVNPIKSGDRYTKTWNEFKEYVNKTTERPVEEDFIQYFDYLKQVKGCAASSIWCYYSQLNHKYQVLFGEKLQKFPRITHLLKSYESGYVRKTSKFFTKEEIYSFLENAPNTGEFIYMKAAVVTGYAGGLRCADLVNIDCEHFEFNETTEMWVSYNVSKQRGEQIVNKFNVPLELCKYLETYDNELDKCSAGKGRMFKTFRMRKDGSWYFTKQPMGVHFLRKISCKVAAFLKLPNPERYTGHCLRRSAANTLAESGMSTVALKKHFNWKSEGTALKYVENTNASKLSVSEKIGTSSKPCSSTEIQASQATTSKVLNINNCSNIIVNF